MANRVEPALGLVAHQVFYHRPDAPHVGAELLKCAIGVVLDFAFPGVGTDPDIARIVVPNSPWQVALAQVGKRGHGATRGARCSAPSTAGKKQNAQESAGSKQPIFFRFFHITWW